MGEEPRGRAAVADQEGPARRKVEIPGAVRPLQASPNAASGVPATRLGRGAGRFAREEPAHHPLRPGADSRRLPSSSSPACDGRVGKPGEERARRRSVPGEPL